MGRLHLNDFYMIISAELVDLRRVVLENPKDIEEIRLIRNSFFNSGTGIQDHLIKPDEHLNWFKSRNLNKEFHFLVIEKSSDKTVGYTASCEVGGATKTAEISIFMREESESMLIPLQVMGLILDFTYDKMKLDRALTKISKKNPRALRFNSFFGFKPFEEDENNIRFELDSSSFKEWLTSYNRFVW